jgi:TolB-like protein/class 3 adenylate cyclase/Tfp pilus assembly protein PilF
MTEQGFKRKLAAILSADVKDYSRMMRDDEDATIRMLTNYRSAISNLIQKFRGHVVDAIGDNMLAKFASVVDAVNCAVEIQRELAERNAELPDERKMDFRIGVNLGDIVEEEGRIYGDGVNIAARMEGLAEAGGVCISGSVHDSVESKLGLEYEFLGEKEVKNIDKPVRAYRVLTFPGAAAHRVVQAKVAVGKKWRKLAIVAAGVLVVVVAAAALWNRYFRYPAVGKASVENMAYPLPEKPSIAVLPFANMSDDPGKEYLSDGITEQIITSLSKIPRLFVISRTSTFTYKDKPVKVQQVAEELGVRYVLEGSVQQSGAKIRITAQLIDALTGRHIWAKRYERNYKDLFALQDEITLKILDVIRLKLTAGEKTRLDIKKKGRNLDTMEKWMEAVTYLRAFNIESNATARQLAEEIIVSEPDRPVGYNLLAWVNIMDVWLGSSKSRRKSIAQATELAQKTIDLEENNDWAYSLLCHIYGMQRQFDKAIAAGQKAIELNPNSDEAYVILAMTLNWIGKVEEAIELIKKAMRLCPFPPSHYYASLGDSYLIAGRVEEAISEYKKALHLTPQHIDAISSLSICYGLLGLKEESRAAAAEAIKLDPNFNIKSFMKILSVFKNQELVKRWADALRKAGIPEG